MLAKIALTLVVVYLAWRLLGRSRPRGSAKPRALETRRCPRCGMYRIAGRPCACDDRLPGED